MDLRIGHLTFSGTPAPARKRAADATSTNGFSVPRTDAAQIGGVPPTPPPDALREVDRAAARADELWRDNRELHFELDEASGRVIVQVRDLDGNVLRTIPASEALDVLAGKPV